MWRILALLALLAAAGGAAAQEAPRLQLPLDCALPERCAVQFYVDRTPGAVVSDYRCGRRSYDTHRGTDFRVLSPEDFRAGVPVLAAAAGRVHAVRDGMDDVDVFELGRGKVENQASGNVVVIAHGGGWSSTYAHLRKGSIAVRKNQSVAAGDKLGVVGLSGDTNFPHLHFELRRGSRTIVDPFAPETGADCAAPGPTLWTPEALAAMAYTPIMSKAGFATRELSRAEATYGRAPEARPAAGAQNLVLWFEVYGLARGDQISVQWGLPGGNWRKPATLVWNSDVPYAFRNGVLGLPAPLPRGDYAVRLHVQRGGAPLHDRVYEITLE